MGVDIDRENIKQLLTERNVPVELIEPSNEHKATSPDLAVTLGNQRVLIEVESKNDDEQLKQLTRQEKGATISYRMGRVEDRILHAWRQIRNFPDRQSSDYTLIWLLAGKCAAILLTGQAARRLLYGIEYLEGYTLDGDYYYKPCYFMHNSIFFKEKQLDAVLIHSVNSLELCLNPYSSRYETFRGSPFVEVLKSITQLVDPVQEEREGRVFIADCEIDRKDIHAVVWFVRSKYQLGRPTITIPKLFNYPA